LPFERFYRYFVLLERVRPLKELHKSERMFFQQMEIRPGSYSYDMWKDLPIPMYMRVYYFNCTNSEEVVSNKAKPL